MRWLTVDDAPLLLAIWNDPAFVNNVGDRGIRTLEEAEQAMHENIFPSYEECGYGPFHVARRSDGAAMGICGIFKREHLEDPDIGFALLPDFCGHGFGWEAAHAVTEYAHHDLRLPRMLAIVSPQNTPSRHLIEKLGMHLEDEDTWPGDDKPVCVYAIEWANAVRR